MSKRLAWLVLAIAVCSVAGVVIREKYFSPIPTRSHAPRAGKTTSAVKKQVAHVKTPVDPQAERRCLAQNIYWEANAQPYEAQRMVGYVTYSRKGVRPWKSTICGVVFQRVQKVPQFSWTIQKHLITRPLYYKEWRVALRAADEVLAGWKPEEPLKCARYYKRTDDAGVSEASKVWFATLRNVGPVGDHSFYCPPLKAGKQK